VRMGGSRRVLVICRVASKQKVEMSHDDSDQKALLYASKNWQSRDQWSGGGRGGGSRDQKDVVEILLVATGSFSREGRLAKRIQQRFAGTDDIIHAKAAAF